MNCYSDKNPKDIKKMFNSIAYNYDKLNNIITLWQNIKMKHKVVKNLKYLNKDKAKILDLCTGTGDIAGIINNTYPQFEVIGVDFSEKMLEKAREKYGDKQTSFSILNIHKLKEYENVSYILDLMKKIKEVLLEAGVDEKYFIL